MPDEASARSPRTLIENTADIVAAYVQRNAITPQELLSVIGSVHQTLTAIVEGRASQPRHVPAFAIRHSLTSDYVISLEDGKPYRTLTRHLAGLGLTPAEYRAKWGLPADYPMVAPNYAKLRSELARQSNLFGHQRSKLGRQDMRAEQLDSSD